MADAAVIDVTTLPFDEEVLALVRRARAEGRETHLASASDQRYVQAVAERCAQLLLDRDLAAAFGDRGRAWVARQWRWDDLALRLRTLLDPATPLPTP